MQSTAESLKARIQTLTADQLAEVEEFIESLEPAHRARASASMSGSASAAIWNNPEDEVYVAL